MQNIVRFFLRLALRVIKVRLNFEFDKETLPKKGIYVSNHLSWLDPIILFAYLPNDPVFLLHPKLFRNKWIQFFMHYASKIEFNYMSAVNVKEIIDIVNSGRCCVTFPEGCMTDTGDLMKIYESPAVIADRTGAPFIPVWISGAEFGPFSETKGKVPHRPLPKIRVRVCRPVPVEINEELKKDRDYLRNITYSLFNKIRFESKFHNNVALFKKLVRMSKIYGKTSPFHRRLILEDINRKPQTYMDLLLKTYALGEKFALHTEETERVGLILPNSVAAVATFFGLSGYNRVPVMLNFSLGGNVVVSMCKTALVKQVISSKTFVIKGKLEPLIETLEENGIKVLYLEDLAKEITLKDKLKAFVYYKIKKAPYKQDCSEPAVILFTSGSEGFPKAVVLSHSNILSNIAQISCFEQLTTSDLIFNSLPMFHSFGLCVGTLFPLFFGARTFLFPSPLQYRTITELLYELKATVMVATDTFYKVYARMSHPFDFKNIRLCYAGAEAVKPETRELMAERLGVRLMEAYGTTECSPVLCINNTLFNKFGTLGKLVPAMKYKLETVEGIENGKELVVKGPNVMLGYMFAEKPGVLVKPRGGWYHTGDVVEIDELGFVKIVDRVKRFAKIGGEMISLKAVENLAQELCTQEDFKVSALAVPHPKKGEQIVLVSNSQDIDRKTFAEIVSKKSLSELYIPSQFFFKEDIPVFATGKTDTVSLKKWVLEQTQN